MQEHARDTVWERSHGRLSSKDVPFGPDEGAALDWAGEHLLGIGEAICVCLQSAEGAQQ